MQSLVAGTIDFYAENLPDFATAHYADGGYCAALMQSATGLGFTFTGHSLGAQKMDKLGINSANAAQMEQQFRFSRRIAAERLAMERAFRIITSTGQERMEQYAHALYDGAVNVNDDWRFAVVAPGVNTRVFNTARGTMDREIEEKLNGRLNHPHQPHLLVSSRIDEKKNILGAVEAYASSPVLQESAGLVICIRGIDDPFEEIGRLSSGEQAVLRPILELIDTASLRGKVDFLNIGSQAELAASYRYFANRQSVFVLTAFYEPFGLAPIEAAACGLACAATRNGGPSEIFADGSGILLDPFDTRDIGAGMLKALDEYQDLSSRSARRVRAKYTWDQTAAGYLSVIEDGLKASPQKLPQVPSLDAGPRISEYLGNLGNQGNQGNP
jgi:sucrose-phosphate synthase